MEEQTETQVVYTSGELGKAGHPYTPDAKTFADVIAKATEQPEPIVQYIEQGTPEQMGELFGAVAQASLEFGDVVKDKKVSYPVKKRDGSGSYKLEFSYAPMSNLTSATRAPLGKYGCVVLQFFTMSRNGEPTAQIRTVLAHKSGGRIISMLEFRPTGDIKELGGQSTYFARYAYQRLLTLDGETDADEIPGTRRTPPGDEILPKSTPKAGRPSKKEEIPEPPPHRDEDAPVEEPTTEVMMSQRQNERIRELFKECVDDTGKPVYSSPKAAKLCRDRWGKGPKELTHKDAEELIAYLETEVRRGQ